MKRTLALLSLLPAVFSCAVAHADKCYVLKNNTHSTVTWIFTYNYPVPPGPPGTALAMMPNGTFGPWCFNPPDGNYVSVDISNGPFLPSWQGRLILGTGPFSLPAGTYSLNPKHGPADPSSRWTTEFNGGVLRIQDETGRWHLEDNNVKAFQIDGTRIAVFKTDGNLLAKDGLDTQWHAEDDHVRWFQLEGNRIAILKSDGNLLAKDGLDTQWHAEDDHVRSFQLEGNRIAILKGDGTLEAKDGLDGPWHPEDRAVQWFQLSGNRISVIETGGKSQYKVGGLDTRWIQQ